jgi:hypothetical protein
MAFKHNSSAVGKKFSEVKDMIPAIKKSSAVWTERKFRTVCLSNLIWRQKIRKQIFLILFIFSNFTRAVICPEISDLYDSCFQKYGFFSLLNPLRSELTSISHSECLKQGAALRM